MEGDDDKEQEEGAMKKKEKKDQVVKAPAISKTCNSDDADISLISSDNVLFKVHSYRLMTFSQVSINVPTRCLELISRSVFRDMLSMPNSAARKDPIYLTDEKLEKSITLKCLLDVMYTLETSVIDTSEVYAVLDLAEKWDFQHVRHAIRRDLPHSNTYMFPRFQVSLKLKDPKLIAGFVKRDHDVVWSHPSKGDSSPEKFFDIHRRTRHVYEDPLPGLKGEGRVPDARVFDVGTWPYTHFLLTPPTVIWALLRATHVGTTTPAKIDHKKVGNEFERLHTLACEFSSSLPLTLLLFRHLFLLLD